MLHKHNRLRQLDIVFSSRRSKEAEKRWQFVHQCSATVTVNENIRKKLKLTNLAHPRIDCFSRAQLCLTISGNGNNSVCILVPEKSDVYAFSVSPITNKQGRPVIFLVLHSSSHIPACDILV
jgi:hypothetical protein